MQKRVSFGGVLHRLHNQCSVTSSRAAAVVIAAGVVVLALWVAGCGAVSETTMTAGPVLRVSVTPWQVAADGRPVSISELDAMLGDLARNGGSVWLEDVSDSGDAVARGYTYTEKQRARRDRRLGQVVDLVNAHGVPLRSSDMPVSGWASPSPSRP